MLTINYLIKYLNIEQKKINDIDNLTDDLTEDLNDDIREDITDDISDDITEDNTDDISKNPNKNNLEVIVNDSIKGIKKMDTDIIRIKDKFSDIFENKNDKSINPYYIKSSDKNRTHIFTLFNSIFSIMNSSFYLLKENSKMSEIKELIKVFQNKLFEEELYKKYYYKSRRFRKTKFIELFNSALNFKTDNEYFYMIKQFISDYIGVNIYILNDIESEYYITKKYTDNVGWIFCYYLEDIYYPVFFDDNENDLNIINMEYIKENIINKHGINYKTIYNNDDDQIDTKIYENMKLDKLQELAAQYKIDARKKSSKTDKFINKTKNEIIEELLEYI
jgi:hypothetical protein